jgi:hypothetical protein
VTAYWEQMSAAGTDGTDLTTTLTTEGDILYRDGSGLQRLAKGTAGQLLQINSGATAPEWTTFSGSPLLQRKFYYFTDEGQHSVSASWTNCIHPIGDGTLSITPTTAGNILQIDYNFFIGHKYK